MLTGNYALSGVCFNTVRLLPHQSAGKDVRSCLFLTSLQNPMISKIATISSWICKLIRLDYESEGSDPRSLELHKVSAHEVRALSASTSMFRGMMVDSVLQSCTWKSRNTFSDFYLRDMCSFIDDIYVKTSSVADT